MHYACDAAWWSGTALDWRSLDCVKVAGAPGPHEAAGVLAADVCGYQMKFGRFLEIGGGGNSGFQVLNLLAQMGARECAIIGLDMGGGGYTHWHGPGWPFGGGRLQHKTVDRWREDTDAAADALESAGLTVVNASPVSALENYRKESLADIFARWEA